MWRVRPQWRTHHELCCEELVVLSEALRRGSKADRPTDARRPAGQPLHPAQQHRDCLGPAKGGIFLLRQRRGRFHFITKSMWAHIILTSDCPPSGEAGSHSDFTAWYVIAWSWGDFFKNKVGGGWFLKDEPDYANKRLHLLASAQTLNALASSLAPPNSNTSVHFSPWRNQFIEIKKKLNFYIKRGAHQWDSLIERAFLWGVSLPQSQSVYRRRL